MSSLKLMAHFKCRGDNPSSSGYSVECTATCIGLVVPGETQVGGETAMTFDTSKPELPKGWQWGLYRYGNTNEAFCPVHTDQCTKRSW